MLLKELFEFLPKSIRPASYGQKEGTYPFFTSSNITDKYCEEADYSGEFLIIGDGGTGNCKYYDGKFSASDHNYILKPLKGTNAKLIRYFLMKDNYKVLNDGFKGVGIKNVSKTYIQNIAFLKKVSTPDEIILQTLSKIENTIFKLNDELDAFDELIKSRFIELFEDAPVKSVEDVCLSFKIGPFGSALHKNEISKEGFAFVLGTDNAVKNEFDFDEIRYINKDKYQQLKSYDVKPGDVIMSMMGTVGRVAIIPDNLGTAIISSHLCILRLNKELMYPEFFHIAFCKDEDIQHQINGIHNGSIMKGFNLKIVKAFEIKCPSLKEQSQFIDFKRLIDKSKFSVQKEIELYQELLDKKMDEYFG